MGQKIWRQACLALSAFFMLAFRSADAAVITLDFETPATGQNIVAAPLVTAAGTITASTSGAAYFLVMDHDEVPFPTGLPGNALFHWQRTGTDTDYAQLAFSFDVSSITFLWSGIYSGVFTAQALDAGLNVIASFSDGNTFSDRPGGPTTLSAVGIRYLRFGDFPGGEDASAIDTVVLTTGAVTAAPEPATIALLGIGVAGLAATRRRKH